MAKYVRRDLWPDELERLSEDVEVEVGMMFYDRERKETLTVWNIYTDEEGFEEWEEDYNPKENLRVMSLAVEFNEGSGKTIFRTVYNKFNISKEDLYKFEFVKKREIDEEEREKIDEIIM